MWSGASAQHGLAAACLLDALYIAFCRAFAFIIDSLAALVAGIVHHVNEMSSLASNRH
jgi:hypothetical protein